MVPFLGWMYALRRALFTLMCVVAIGVVVASWGGISWLQSGPAIPPLPGLIPGLALPQPLYARAGGAGVLTFLLLLAILREVLAGWRRGWLRSRAIHGRRDALPPAYLTLPTVEVPNVALVPLEGLLTNTTFGSVDSVLADVAGVHQRSLSGRDRLVRWEDAQLLEVERPDNAQTLTYVLFGRRGRVAWGDSAPKRSPSALFAYQHTHAQMIALIQARTGLIPRTFDRDLREPGSHRAAASLGQRAGAVVGLAWRALSTGVGYLTLLGLIAALLVGAYSCVALPLTNVPALNIYAASSLGLVGFVLLVSAIVGIGSWLPALQRHSHHHDAAPTLPEPPSPGHYVLRWRESRWTQLATLLLGIALLADGAPPVLVWWSTSFASTVKPFAYIFVSIPLLILAGIGLIAILSALLGRPPRVTADKSGLVHGSVAIPWDQVSAFAWSGKPGRGSYTVTSGMNAKHTITWPERPARVLPVRDAQPISPGELAALVVARNGVALRAERAPDV